MIIAYKAFDKDLSCTSGGNRFQYRLGIWNEEDAANCSHNGFHCAENPLLPDILFRLEQRGLLYGLGRWRH